MGYHLYPDVHACSSKYLYLPSNQNINRRKVRLNSNLCVGIYLYRAKHKELTTTFSEDIIFLSDRVR